MTTLRKKIAYVSGTRADFGLMSAVLKAVENSETFSLKVYATGMHLMPEFGSTIELVRKEFSQVKIIDAIFVDNTASGTVKFTAKVLAKVTDAFLTDRPDFVLLLGDRPEMLAVAIACLYLGIPTAHLHGGERTGTHDEVARHAITKLASLHFPATSDAADRIKRMGEENWRIEVVGAPALEVLRASRLPSKDDVAAFIHIPVSQKFVLLVQHPSVDRKAAGSEMEETIAALKTIALPVVCVYPNADVGSTRIIDQLEKERTNPLFRIFKNISYEMFLAIEREAAVWVGNSSAALIESASFKTPVVNIGDRQRGRLRGKNVLDVPHRRLDITLAIQKSLFNRTYKKKLQTVTNPWGDGKTAKRVLATLVRTDIGEKLLQKQISY